MEAGRRPDHIGLSQAVTPTGYPDKALQGTKGGGHSFHSYMAHQVTKVIPNYEKYQVMTGCRTKLGHFVLFPFHVVLFL